MKSLYTLASIGAILFVVAPVTAQETKETTVNEVVADTVPTTNNVILKSTSDNVLRAGTSITLAMMEGLTTKGKKLRVGQQFRMETVEAIAINGQTVIPVGSPATGEITAVRNKGMWGKSGRINARILYLRVNGRQIRLSGQFDDKGVTGTAGVVGALVLVPIAGFFMTGTSAKIPVGAQIKAFIDEDIEVEFAGKPAPMVVNQGNSTAVEAANDAAQAARDAASDIEDAASDIEEAAEQAAKAP